MVRIETLNTAIWYAMEKMGVFKRVIFLLQALTDDKCNEKPLNSSNRYVNLYNNVSSGKLIR